MPDSNEAVPAPCQVIKEDVDKCVKEKGAESCKDLIDAFQACIKNSVRKSLASQLHRIKGPSVPASPASGLNHPTYKQGGEDRP